MPASASSDCRSTHTGDSATVLSAAALGSATTSIVGGTAHSLVGAASSQAAAAGPIDGAIDLLFRGAAPAGAATQPVTRAEARAEMTRLFASKLSDGGDLSSEDSAYAARVVAAQTGLSPNGQWPGLLMSVTIRAVRWAGRDLGGCVCRLRP